MALADYRLCDVCEGKAFYDAQLNYEIEGAAVKLDHLGDWSVICEECAKTHRTCVVAHDVSEALVVAAPAMLVALKRMLELGCDCEGCSAGRAAIAKATGES